MCRLTYFGIFSLVISMLMGCAMCCGPYDDHYNLYGGKFQRADPVQGRVGSIFSDPAYRGGGPSADSNLAPETPMRAPEVDDDDTESRRPNTDAGQSEEDIQREMERLRKELQLDGGSGGELPSPGTTPQPDIGDDRETSRGWQNRLRDRNRQWR